MISEKIKEKAKYIFSKFIDVLFNRYSTGAAKLEKEDVSLKVKFYNWLLLKAEKNNWNGLKGFIEKRISRMKSVKNKVLVKYICKELFIFFIVLFIVFFAVFFVNQFLLVVEFLLKKHVPFLTAFKLIVYYMPAIIAQSAPFATLVGFLMCLGRLVTDNEILILRASGLRYSLIFIPVIVMGLLISVFSFVMNDYFLPIGNMKAQQLYKTIASSNPAVELEPNSVKTLGSTFIVIGDVDKTKVSDMVMFDKDNDKERIIIARNSDVKKVNAEGVLMQMLMNDSSVVILDQNNKRNFDLLKSDEMILNIFDDTVDLGLSSGNSPSTMTSLDLGRYISNMKSNASTSPYSLNVYRLEFSKKFTIPFASIFFALLAFPLALVLGKRDGQVLGLVFGLVISVLYWAMTIMGQMFGVKSGLNGYFVTWVPNVLIGLMGIFFYLRLRRK